mgnify:CR=1 FL=1
MFVIEDELKKLPDKPGVYLMRGEDDEIIYVGKAISLRRRVRQYFQGSRNRGPKIERMVTHIRRFEYIVTDSEAEALVLECNLIKEHHPKYNTMLMDDKTYPYIKVTTGEAYPRLLTARRVGSDRNRNKYFGPYPSAGAVKDIIDLLKRLYHIRSCSRKLPEDFGKGRPCLNYHIGQCDAPCQGRISSEEYMPRIQKAIDFLNGHHKEIQTELEEKMRTASEKMEYEAAAGYRDLLESIRQIAENQKITSSGGGDRDIIAVARGDREAVAQVFFIRGGKLLGRDHFYLSTAEGDSLGAVLESFVKQYYAGTPYIPHEVMLPVIIEDAPAIEAWLGGRVGHHVRILVPQKGRKEQLMLLAEKNARMVLDQDADRLKREAERTTGATREIAELLRLPSLSRLEAYDISNTGGYESVGSMVVYENGRPKRSDYRKFRIRTIVGSDDYGSLREVLTRRFSHGLEERKAGEESGFTKFPDLIMMDGGKGQVNSAGEALREMGLNIPVCGMVKDDRHRTRGVYYLGEEISIDKSSEGFKLITRVQDEAHRFAITYHRQLRSAEQVHSVLDDIPGIGPARRKALRKRFETIEEIKEATIEELESVPSFNKSAAKAVYTFFHQL